MMQMPQEFSCSTCDAAVPAALELSAWICFRGPKKIKHIHIISHIFHYSHYRFPKWWIFHWENNKNHQQSRFLADIPRQRSPLWAAIASTFWWAQTAAVEVWRTTASAAPWEHQLLCPAESGGFLSRHQHHFRWRNTKQMTKESKDSTSPSPTSLGSSTRCWWAGLADTDLATYTAKE